MRSNILFDILVAIVTLISTTNATPATMSSESSSLFSSVHGQSALKVQTPDGNHIDTPQQQKGGNLTVNYLNRLVPPAGTCWFKRKEVFITGTSRNITLDTRTDVYVYATGANPHDADFQKKGGMFYVVAVPRGTISSPMRIWFSSVKFKFDSMRIVTALPRGAGCSLQGDHIYDIEFAQTRTMFKDGGNTAFNFTAEYRDSLTRTDTCQEIETKSDSLSFYYESGKDNPIPTIIDVFGLAVLHLPYVETVNLEITISGLASTLVSYGETEKTPIDLSFKEMVGCNPESYKG